MVWGVAEQDSALISAEPARVLGPIDATCIVVGAIIGVGIFFNPSQVAGLVQSEPLALLAWAIGGLIALCGALVFAELGGMYHSSGAQYEILRDSYGSPPAFLFGFCNVTAIQPGSMAVIAMVCAENLLAAAGADGERLGDSKYTALLAISITLIIMLAAANIIGVRWGSRIQNLTVYAKVFTLLAVTGMAIWFASSAGDHHANGESAAESTAVMKSPAIIAAMLAALVPTLFAYGGWQQVLWIGGEVRQPRRNLPLSIIVGVVVVVAVYLLANWAYLTLLGVGGVAGSGALAADAVGAVWPGLGRRVVAGAVAVSAFGVLNTQLLTGPRLIYGMARDGRFFPPFAKLHAKFGTPVPAIALLTLVSLILLIAAGKDAADQLVFGVVQVDAVFFILTGVALFILRVKRRNADRPVRVPLYPVVPLLFILGEVGVVIGSHLEPNVRNAALIGVAWIIFAATVYLVFFRKRSSP